GGIVFGSRWTAGRKAFQKLDSLRLAVKTVASLRLGEPDADRVRGPWHRLEEVFVRRVIAQGKDEIRFREEKDAGGGALANSGRTDLDDLASLENIGLAVFGEADEGVGQLLDADGSQVRIGPAIVPGDTVLFLFDKCARQPIHVKLHQLPDPAFPV